jgi:hypothetical protein
LLKGITELRLDFAANADIILTIKKILSVIIEKETVAKVQNMKIFDCLNTEKASPMFLNLRVSNSDKIKLPAIYKPNDESFLNREF